MRQMVLVGFLQAQNCSNLASSWRHPASRTDSWSPDFYRHIGRVLEEGKFHLGFFDDRLSMPDMYGRDHAHTVAHGIRCVKLDAVTVLTVMGMATERLGLGATYSTSYYEPFHVARVFATLDLMTQGRAAWNVVTSLNDGEAQNMGRDEVIGHDLRYDRADEFMEIVLGHWDAWEDDAIVQDKATGLFARPEKVHRLDYQGRYFRSRGPFTVPRSAQGHPVLIQAGSSGRGKTLRRALGRGDLRRLSEHRGRPARLCGVQGGGRRASAAIPKRSRSPTSSTRWRPRPKPRPRTSGRRSKNCRSRSTRCRCCRRRSTSILPRRAWTSRSRQRSWTRCPACKASATAW